MLTSPTQAVTQSRGYDVCGAGTVIIASHTTGNTSHTVNYVGGGSYTWQKGYKNSQGATSYTNRHEVGGTSVYASSVINSAGTRCSG